MRSYKICKFFTIPLQHLEFLYIDFTFIYIGDHWSYLNSCNLS